MRTRGTPILGSSQMFCSGGKNQTIPGFVYCHVWLWGEQSIKKPLGCSWLCKVFPSKWGWNPRNWGVGDVSNYAGTDMLTHVLSESSKVGRNWKRKTMFVWFDSSALCNRYCSELASMIFSIPKWGLQKTGCILLMYVNFYTMIIHTVFGMSCDPRCDSEPKSIPQRSCTQPVQRRRSQWCRRNTWQEFSRTCRCPTRTCGISGFWVGH